MGIRNRLGGSGQCQSLFNLRPILALGQPGVKAIRRVCFCHVLTLRRRDTTSPLTPVGAEAHTSADLASNLVLGAKVLSQWRAIRVAPPPSPSIAARLSYVRADEQLLKTW